MSNTISVNRATIDHIYDQLTFLAETLGGPTDLLEKHHINGLALILSNIACTVYELMEPEPAREVR